MRRAEFGSGECYHVYNRGVEKREVFTTPADYARFLYHLVACNNRRPLLNSQYYYRGLTSIERVVTERGREPLVDLLCFCFMPNHFHLLLRQRIDEGIPLFMQKVGTAYTMYFNAKYQRSGGLFQGTYKSIHVASDQYLLPVSRYVHLNPLDLLQPGWKECGLRSPHRAQTFVREYRWSSYADFCGDLRYPSALNQRHLRETFGPPKAYRAYVEDWNRRALSRISHLTIEPHKL